MCVGSLFACCHEADCRLLCVCLPFALLLLLLLLCMPIVYSGPGCSSVGLNFLKGSGPFIPVSDSRMLLLNPNSFTKFANVLWLDQPLYTGWSTSKDEADRNTGACESLAHYYYIII
jgi:hypothetical protein